MKIWIDADACPKLIKEYIFKSSYRLQVHVCLVANNYMNIPHSPLISFIHVEQGDDVADNYIADHIVEGDLVVTADIPLAAIVVSKGVTGINPRGEIYTEENVGERLSMRDFMKSIRDSGVDTGGPSSFDAKDKERFANSFNRIMTQMMKK